MKFTLNLNGFLDNPQHIAVVLRDIACDINRSIQLSVDAEHTHEGEYKGGGFLKHVSGAWEFEPDGERRSDFSKSSPGVGNRKNDV